MTTTELIAAELTQNLEVLKFTLGDFSDADMLVRPVPGANHTAWQLGHLIAAEPHLINMAMPGSVPPAPAEFAAKFKKETASSDDPAAFPKKAELITALEQTRGRTIEWVRKLSDADLDKPMPEQMRTWCPTVGRLALMHAGHTTMHIGQFQVIRRKLGKPLLF